MKKVGETNRLVGYRKKGLSPIVATVLLVALAIILILIIFLLFRSFFKEIIEKNEQHIKYSCEEVNLEPELFLGPYPSANNLYIVNRGNIPVHKVAVKKIKKGSSEVATYDIKSLDNLDGPGKDLLPGVTGSVLAIGDVSGYMRLNVIPILLGTTSKGAIKPYQCPDEFGTIYELS